MSHKRELVSNPLVYGVDRWNGGHSSMLIELLL